MQLPGVTLSSSTRPIPIVDGDGKCDEGPVDLVTSQNTFKGFTSDRENACTSGKANSVLTKSTDPECMNHHDT